MATNRILLTFSFAGMLLIGAGCKGGDWCKKSGPTSEVGRYTLQFSPEQKHGPYLLDSSTGRVWQLGYPTEEATPEWRWLPRREEFENPTQPAPGHLPPR